MSPSSRRSPISIEIVELESVSQPQAQPHVKLSPIFYKTLCANVILFIVMGLIIWQLVEESHTISEIKSHEVYTREQILNETSLHCSQLYQIGYNTAQGRVVTRELTFDCPLKDGKCSCESYSNAWIFKQALYSIYYFDTDPMNWSRRPASPREGQFIGLVIGISVCGCFWLFTLFFIFMELFGEIKR